MPTTSEKFKIISWCKEVNSFFIDEFIDLLRHSTSQLGKKYKPS